MAVKGGHLDMVEYLVNSDADINIKDNKGVRIISELGFELACLIIITMQIHVHYLFVLLNHSQNK